MPGTLYVVATPIGNLEDITLRALRVLGEAALVAAEDTRRTGNLLRHYKIATPLVSLHEHNEHQRAGELIKRLQAGDSVALVSDAGTPGISDPGAFLVKAAREAGLGVEPVPGPSAITAVLSSSGLSFDRFAFAGFPPTASKRRRAWFAWVAAQTDVPVVCFEAPHRIRRTLDECARMLVERPIIVARELTKLHEQWLEGTPSDIGAQLGDGRGEFVFVVGPGGPSTGVSATLSDREIVEIFGQITELGQPSKREAIKLTAHRLGLTARTVYAAVERWKHSVE